MPPMTRLPRVHAGEFQALISRLAGDEEELLEDGRKEVEEMAEGTSTGDPGE